MLARSIGFAVVMGSFSYLLTLEAFAQPCVPNLNADTNGDCIVDPLDSGYVLARFGCPVGTGDPSCDSGDANGDGIVDPLDSGYILARFCGGGNLPIVAVDPPVPLTKALTISLEGTSVGATQVEVSGGAELVTVDVIECTFDAEVSLVENQVNFLYVTGISGEGVRGTPYPVTVTNDTKHPDLFITFPQAGRNSPPRPLTWPGGSAIRSAGSSASPST